MGIISLSKMRDWFAALGLYNMRLLIGDIGVLRDNSSPLRWGLVNSFKDKSSTMMGNLVVQLWILIITNNDF